MAETILAVLAFYFLFSIGWIARGWWDRACYLAEQRRTVGVDGIRITNMVPVPVNSIKYDA